MAIPPNHLTFSLTILGPKSTSALFLFFFFSSRSLNPLPSHEHLSPPCGLGDQCKWVLAHGHSYGLITHCCHRRLFGFLEDFITTERLDPIVNPGKVSGHVHSSASRVPRL